jgi:CheY-like chemotaxis protein
VTSGKIGLQRQAFDLVAVLQAALDEVLPAGQLPGPVWKMDLPPEGLVIEGDPVRLHQVFTNLFTNACKYTPPAGQVVVTLRSDGQGVVVQVADTGVGISQEVLPIIFEPFAQADRTLDRSQGGMGLGLTVVRALVELHGGRVEVDSPGPGQGSVFTVRLPVAPPGLTTAVAAPPPAPPAASLRRPRHVLLIEDSEDIRDSLQELLAELGHRVEVAADGEQGVAQTLASRPEVALVDIGLPRIDGYEVARRVRAALGGDILLIALTGYGQPEDALRARAAGFDHHLRKPMSIDEIDRLLGGRSGRGDEARQQQRVGGDDEADEAGEDDAVLEHGAEDGRLVPHLVRGSC